MASLLQPVDDYGRTTDVGSFLDRLRSQPPTDPIWPVSNPTGTEQLVDYRGYDQPPVAPPASPATRDLPRDPTTQNVGSFISEGFPAALNAVFPMLPAASDWASKFFGLSQAPRTGTVTPEETMSLLSMVDPAARPQEGLLGSLRVNTPGGNIARVDRRSVQDNTLLDATPGLGRTIGQMVDQHVAASGVDLYGARAPADVMVTLPPTVTSPASIAEQRQKMVDQATAMTQNIPPGASEPRYWYRDSGEAFHAATGEDLEATRRVAAAHAITSPQTDVQGNANFAVNAWAQSLLGDPIAVSSGQKNAALEEALYGSELPSSRKTGPFYENPIRYLDPAMAANIKTNITNDIWAMRQVGFQNKGGAPYSGTPVTGEDNYVRLMYDQAARDLNAAGVNGGGWNPDQVQAALWTYERLGETGRAQPSGFNFGDALHNLTAAQSNAHEAGPALLGAAAGDPQAQGAFQQAARPLLVDQHGRDIVNSSLGLLTPPNVPGGAYAAVTADGIKPASRTLMDASTLMRATLLRQPDAVWLSHGAPIAAEPSYANASAVHSFSVDPDHAPMLRSALDQAGGGLENAHVEPTPTGARVVNISPLTGLTNPDFQRGVRGAMRDAGLPTDLKRSRTDYGYFSHDWNADPTGSGYIAALSRLPPNLQRVGDQLFAQHGGGLDAAASAISGISPAARGASGLTGPWAVPGFAGAVGPADTPLPLRPWVQRPLPTDPGSNLLSLLGGARP